MDLVHENALTRIYSIASQSMTSARPKDCHIIPTIKRWGRSLQIGRVPRLRRTPLVRLLLSLSVLRLGQQCLRAVVGAYRQHHPPTDQLRSKSHDRSWIVDSSYTHDKFKIIWLNSCLNIVLYFTAIVSLSTCFSCYNLLSITAVYFYLEYCTCSPVY